MPLRIAIPMPHSIDLEYSERAIPQYEQAVALAGGEAIRIPLHAAPDEIRTLIDRCDGVLLPGSNADVDPAKFRQARSPHTATADPRRDDIDALLLEDAYACHKPILGICYGLQSLNVFRNGSLIQHIPDFLPEETRARVDHEAGKKVAIAHTVAIEQNSALGKIMRSNSRLGCPSESEGEAERQAQAQQRELPGSSRADADSQEKRALIVPVNSSHHQSADAIGEGLRIVARCAEDGIIEALEGTAPDHFVLAVQWHPERSVNHDGPSRAIFHAFLQAVR